MLVQQRSHDKITFPSIWANSCCSHPLDIPGENGDPAEGAINAARRKLSQELGVSEGDISRIDFRHVGSFLYECRWDEDWIESKRMREEAFNEVFGDSENLEEVEQGIKEALRQQVRG